MCAENHVCFERIHGTQLREGANAGQHTPTLSLPPSHHCLDGEVYRGTRHYNVCEHVGLDTNQSLHHPPERDVCTYSATGTICTIVGSTRSMCTMSHVYNNHGTRVHMYNITYVPGTVHVYVHVYVPW